MRAHSYFTATTASGALLRICAACGETSELCRVEDKDEPDSYGWFPVGEYNEHGKPQQGQRDCVGEKGSDTRNNGGSNGKEATVVRRAG